MHEQRAFAAVRPIKGGKFRVLAGSTQNYAYLARAATGRFFVDGWPEAKRQGWRIRPVIIRLEEQDNG